MHTVPLRSDGGGQRANLIEIPSGVLRTPITAPSGTGLAGMETRFIARVCPAIWRRPHLIAYRNRRQRSTSAEGRPLRSRGRAHSRAALTLEGRIGLPIWRDVQAIRLHKPGPAYPRTLCISLQRRIFH